jgi:hypothetical protein
MFAKSDFRNGGRRLPVVAKRQLYVTISEITFWPLV